MVANTITEYAYLFKHEFSSILFFALYLGATALKLIIPFVLLLTSIKRQVISKVPKSFCSDIDQEQRILLTRVYQKQGASLYTAIPLFYITGSFRLMGCTNFTQEITIGFILDFTFTLAMVFIQSINNATLSSVTKPLANSNLEFACFILKVVALADLSLELMMFVYEVYRLRHLTRVDCIVKFDEEQRRTIYGHKYLKRSLSALSVTVVGCLILTMLLPAKQCRERQSLHFETVCVDCQLDHC